MRNGPERTVPVNPNANEPEAAQGKSIGSAQDHRSLGELATRGAFWSTLGFGAGQVLRLAANLVLTRLLFAEAFGLMALVQTFLAGLQLFSDLGIGTSIIQNERGDDRDFLDTAFTMQAARGLLLLAVTCAGAVPFAHFYRQPVLVWVLPVAGLTALIQGVQSTKLYTANRHLAMKRLIAVELAGQVAGVTTMMTWAAVDRSVWALVAGSVAGTACQTILSHVALPGQRNKFHWERDSARNLLKFGRWIFVSTALMFLAGQSDRLIFGKLTSIQVLGVYSIATTLALLPSAALSNLAGRIILPVYSRVYTSGGDLDATYRPVRWPLLVLGGWAMAGLVGGGPTIVRLLYDRRYIDAGWMLQVVATGVWFGVLLEGTNGAALLAKGLARWTAAGSAGKLIGMLVLIPVGFVASGFPGALVGLAAAEMFRYAISAFAVRRQGLRGLRQDASITAMVGITSSIGWLSARWIRGAGVPVALEATAVFLLVTAGWAPLAAPLLRRGRERWLPIVAKDGS